MSDYTLFARDELIALADMDIQKENYESALEKLKIVSSRGQIPEDAQAMLGRLYASIGLLQRAKNSFIKLLEQKPNAIHERFQLGMVERDLGNIMKAQQVWDEVLSESEDYPPALFFKAATYVDVDEYSLAIPLLEKLKETASETNEFFIKATELLNQLKIQ